MQIDPSVLAQGQNNSYPTTSTKPTSPQPSVKSRPRQSCATNSASAVPGKPHPYNGPRTDLFSHRKSLCPYPPGLGQGHDPTRLVSLPKLMSCSVLAELSPAEETCSLSQGKCWSPLGKGHACWVWQSSEHPHVLGKPLCFGPRDFQPLGLPGLFYSTSNF